MRGSRCFLLDPHCIGSSWDCIAARYQLHNSEAWLASEPTWQLLKGRQHCRESHPIAALLNTLPAAQAMINHRQGGPI
jgi:hypothetical protein